MSFTKAIGNQRKQRPMSGSINSAPKPNNAKVLRQQQRILKQNYRNSGNGQFRRVEHRVWRKTIVVTKPKPKDRVPRLFRADRLTGLPLDYERTVSRIMSYVNPQHSRTPSPEKALENLFSQQLAGIFELCSRNNQCPRAMKNQIRLMLKSYGTKTPQCSGEADNRNLCEFHSACTRGPTPRPEFQAPPTYKSKFNYNTLRIHTT
ncbi:uncharacterized protein LOC6575565 [Drosophila mojavensis]|uniref:Uncharacterized protein n=1 Tax=Drosophila mojavensis TaxID=7230 RepID=B4KFQ1_DROMO|nr:uncharacterized protein LOC6575565 [Drosophila mojavensis]EDW11016.2 uncharacterized protein Dmoj_GI16503 [Drosophila mojavensis]